MFSIKCSTPPRSYYSIYIGEVENDLSALLVYTEVYIFEDSMILYDPLPYDHACIPDTFVLLSDDKALH